MPLSDLSDRSDMLIGSVCCFFFVLRNIDGGSTRRPSRIYGESRTCGIDIHTLTNRHTRRVEKEADFAPLCLPMIRHLKSPDLFSTIDRVPALGTPVNTRTFELFNPSTGELLAQLPDMGVEETPRQLREPMWHKLNGQP